MTSTADRKTPRPKVNPEIQHSTKPHFQNFDSLLKKSISYSLPTRLVRNVKSKSLREKFESQTPRRPRTSAVDCTKLFQGRYFEMRNSFRYFLKLLKRSMHFILFGKLFHTTGNEYSREC